MIKVLIADDQMLIRESLKMFLESRENFCVTGLVSNGIEVLESVRKDRPDVILMDIRMPKLDGVQCTKKIKEEFPQVKIIILTTFDDDDYVYNALKFGASGYMLKGISLEELEKAIEVVYSGQAMINPDIAGKVLDMFCRMANDTGSIKVSPDNIENINATEWKIIREIEKGSSNKEISQELNLSEGTVRNYLSTILDKLGLRDRTQLAIWAVQMNMN